MGREQRSRRRLGIGDICYLCTQPIKEGEEWNRDHVPPERIFGRDVRRRFGPQLWWLPTHRTCNSSYKSDEEYFVVALAGHHRTATGEAVWSDIARGAAKGHGIGLIKQVIGQFGDVTLPDGSMVFGLDTARATRIAWKIVRGLYALSGAVPIPESHPHRIEIAFRSEADKRLEGHVWFPLVRDTQSLAPYGAVFDYKWVGIPVGGMRAHAFAMLLWDSLIILSLFHDPSCSCEGCGVAKSGLAESSH